MIDMVLHVKEAFPHLFTRKGVLRKSKPKRYRCECGETFSRLKTTMRLPGVTFGSPICPKCGEKAKENIDYNIWMRLSNGQITQEDFILNLLLKRGTIEKNDLLTILNEEFSYRTDALSHLVYFGYLLVNERKKQHWNMIEYSLNPKKDLIKRYECIH